MNSMLLFIGLSLLSGLIAPLSSSAATALIKADGSSTVFPITEAVAEEFQTSKKGKIRVTVGISGTGGGFKKFCRGETDVQNASRPISSGELEDCRKNGVKFYELPVGYDAMVVVVHPQADWLKEITIEQLKKIWEPAAQGKIMKWNQVEAKWPDAPLRLFGAGSDSGTFDYFTEAVVGKAKSSRGDYTATEEDNMTVKGVSKDKNALGYFGLAYYVENKDKLKALPVIGAPGKAAVLPSRETVEDGSYNPLSRPMFIYVTEAFFKKPEGKEFTEFYLNNAQRLVPQAKYVPLPMKAYELGLDHLKKGKMGSIFAGKPSVGMKIEEMMKLEGTL